MSDLNDFMKDIWEDRDKMLTEVKATVQKFADKYPWLRLSISLGHPHEANVQYPDVIHSTFSANVKEAK